MAIVNSYQVVRELDTFAEEVAILTGKKIV